MQGRALKAARAAEMAKGAVKAKDGEDAVADAAVRMSAWMIEEPLPLRMSKQNLQTGRAQALPADQALRNFHRLMKIAHGGGVAGDRNRA